MPTEGDVDLASLMCNPQKYQYHSTGTSYQPRQSVGSYSHWDLSDAPGLDRGWSLLYCRTGRYCSGLHSRCFFVTFLTVCP